MQAVFEKIIEELEKLDVKAIKRYKGGTFGDYEGTDYYIKKSDAIEIVKQEAEQYKGGWIPCSGCADCEHKECENYGKV